MAHKLSKKTQYQVVAKLLQLVNTADPAERRKMAEQLFDTLGITEDNRLYGIDIDRTRPGRKTAKIVLGDDDQHRVFAALLAAHESNNAGDRESVRKHLRGLLTMFDIAPDARQEARTQHSEQADRGGIDALGRMVERLLTGMGGDEPHAPPPPAPVEATLYELPTAQMRQALARFDDLSDEQQVDFLSMLWGGE